MPMQTTDDLRQALERLDGKGYKAYKAVKGSYRGPALRLTIDHVQGDPYAEPSRFTGEAAPDEAALPGWAYSTPARRVATADFINRALAAALRAHSSDLGSGKSGELRVLRPGQEVLRRSSVTIRPDGAVEARFRVGLPARGRRILGRGAARLVSAAEAALGEALFFAALDEAALRRHVETVEDARALRSQLPGRGLVAFVADGARLPRRSGIDDRPLEADAVPFESPESLRVTLETPNAGPLSGMGVPEGVTLVVGGGYHGKSTLLRAIERGVYDHVPGDGRERVVTVPGAVKVRAEDGRRIAGTDISPFIGRLPGGEDTRRFTTENASGSTSQAAAIVEALEVGATALLLDEDTSATNFMIRDARMQRLIHADDEPITPFIDRARQLHERHGVSTVLVVGGSGDYFDVADTVVAMREYRPKEVTDAARAVARDLPTQRREEGGAWPPPGARRVLPDSIDPSRGRRDVSVRVRALDRVEFGDHRVELAAVEQLVETAQTRAIAEALVTARSRAFPEAPSLPAAVSALMDILEGEGLDAFHPHRIGELAEFRRFELAAFLNRLRSLRTEPAAAPPAESAP